METILRSLNRDRVIKHTRSKQLLHMTVLRKSPTILIKSHVSPSWPFMHSVHRSTISDRLGICAMDTEPLKARSMNQVEPSLFSSISPSACHSEITFCASMALEGANRSSGCRETPSQGRRRESQNVHRLIADLVTDGLNSSIAHRAPSQILGLCPQYT